MYLHFNVLGRLLMVGILLLIAHGNSVHKVIVTIGHQYIEPIIIRYFSIYIVVIKAYLTIVKICSHHLLAGIVKKGVRPTYILFFTVLDT